MMMTSGGGAKYKGSIDCFTQVLKNEGFMSLMKGAGANILRGGAGAGVLAGFDKFHIERQRGAISCLLRRSVTEVRAMHSFSLDG